MVPHLLESLLHWALVAYKGKSNNAFFLSQGFPITKVFHSIKLSLPIWSSVKPLPHADKLSSQFQTLTHSHTILQLPTYLTLPHTSHLTPHLTHHLLFSQFLSLSLPKWTKYQSKISCIQFPSLPFSTDVCVGNPPHYNNTFSN